MQTRNDTQARDKVWDLIKDIKIAQLITHDGEKLHARPMSAVARENETLWFMTRFDSPKVEEIAKNPYVLLSYSEPKDQNYVAIHGNATLVKNSEKINALWSEFARVWFPEGPSDPTIALIRVDVESAEYWDSPSSTFIYAYGYLKARLTGEAPKNIGDMGHVDMKNAS